MFFEFLFYHISIIWLQMTPVWRCRVNRAEISRSLCQSVFDVTQKWFWQNKKCWVPANKVPQFTATVNERARNIHQNGNNSQRWQARVAQSRHQDQEERVYSVPPFGTSTLFVPVADRQLDNTLGPTDSRRAYVKAFASLHKGCDVFTSYTSHR